MDTSQSVIQVRERESKRRFRTVEEKRRIVEETLVPGASVARVARAHGVNANQVFGWRRLYRQGQLEPKESDARLPVGGQASSLLPVHVTDATVLEAARSTTTGRTPSGMIHLELPKGRLRIAGRVDAEALRVVLEKLLA